MPYDLRNVDVKVCILCQENFTRTPSYKLPKAGHDQVVSGKVVSGKRNFLGPTQPPQNPRFWGGGWKRQFRDTFGPNPAPPKSQVVGGGWKLRR